MRTPIALALISLMVLGACGQPPEDPVTRVSSGAEDQPLPVDQVYEGTGLVLDKDDEPMFCLGGANDSLPPQCGGPKIDGWSWKGVEFEEAAGVKWATLTLRGTYIDGVFTLTGEPKVPEPWEGGDGDPIETPCPEPPGGWPVPDPDLTSEDDLRNAIRAAEAQEDSSGAWIDYLQEPQTEEEMIPQGTNVVLTLSFTGDAERHEQEAREHWGGALCIWLQDRTQKELSAIQKDLDPEWIEEFGVERTWSDSDVTTGIVSLGVIVSNPEFEAELERRYGPGVVRVVPALRPVD